MAIRGPWTDDILIRELESKENLIMYATRYVLVAALLLLVESSAARGASNPDAFCTGDPCVINGTHTVDNGAVLDFGNRTVLLNGTLDLGSGEMVLKANVFTIGEDGQIKGLGNGSSDGGSLTIDAVAGISINSTKTLGAIRLNGQNGGSLWMTATAGSIIGVGKITANHDGNEGWGGNVILDAAGAILYTGPIEAKGGTQGLGGLLSTFSGGFTYMTGDITLDGDLALVDVVAGSNITLGEITADGKGAGSDAGEIFLDALTGAITVSGAVKARGSNSSSLDCGDGGTVNAFAAGAIEFQDFVNLNARAGNCSAGEFVASGNSVTLSGLVEVAGRGSEGFGSDVVIEGTDGVTITGGIQTDGGEGSSGDVFLLSDTGPVTVTGNLDSHARTSNADGGVIEVIAGGPLYIDVSNVDARGGAEGDDGYIDLSGCSVTLSGAYKGPTSIWHAISSGAPDLAGATFHSGAPTVTVDPAIPSCTQ